jgi:hypothetical protein
MTKIKEASATFAAIGWLVIAAVRPWCVLLLLISLPISVVGGDSGAAALITAALGVLRFLMEPKSDDTQ